MAAATHKHGWHQWRCFAELSLILFCACPAKEAAIRSGPQISDQDNAQTGGMLIDADILPKAVVEVSRTGKARADIEDLRNTLCSGHRNEPVVFYQLVVGRRWHYYWLCSGTGALRAATASGNRELKGWVEQIKNRASNESAGCSRDSRGRLFEIQHRSGIRAEAYCEGRLELYFPDGERMARRFKSQARQSQENKTNARSKKQNNRGVRCPPCPAQGSCSKRERRGSGVKGDDVDCREYGQAAFTQGVRKACTMFCPRMYKKCRSTMGRQSAICHQLTEYCEEKCCANLCEK
ncbi:MAG: hypothetical protein V1754_08930 [Pseudomonadota bacterium]